MSESCI